MMPKFSSQKIQKLLGVSLSGITTTQKGKALEELVCYLFERVPGISSTHRDQLNTFHSEEIDIALWNEKKSNYFDFLPNIILIEAKNWTNPVGSAEVSWFDQKLRHRGLDFGVLIAISGISGDAAEHTSAHQIVSQSLSEQRRIVVMTGADLNALKGTDDLITLIKTKLCELAVTGTIFP